MSPVEFSESVLDAAWERQNGLCAACGKVLVDLNRKPRTRGAWNPHHREPVSLGGPGTLDNCLILCVNPNGGCHLQVGHDGYTGSDYVAPWSTFPFLHG